MGPTDTQALNLTTQVRSVAEVYVSRWVDDVQALMTSTTAVAAGDLSKKINVAVEVARWSPQSGGR